MKEIEDIYTIHKLVLSGALVRFPEKTWSQPQEAKFTLIKLTRHTVIEKLKWERSDFCNQFCLAVIKKYRLNGGFGKVYNRNIFPFVTEAFPEWEVRPWELRKSRVPAYFWNNKTAVEATRWLVEEVLKWDLEKAQNEIANSHFHKNNLGGMLRTLKIGAVEAVTMAYPDYDWTYLKERSGYVLTMKQAQEIREVFASGTINQRQIAKKFGTDPSRVNLIIKNKIFKEVNTTNS